MAACASSVPVYLCGRGEQQVVVVVVAGRPPRSYGPGDACAHARAPASPRTAAGRSPSCRCTLCRTSGRCRWLQGMREGGAPARGSARQAEAAGGGDEPRATAGRRAGAGGPQAAAPASTNHEQRACTRRSGTRQASRQRDQTGAHAVRCRTLRPLTDDPHDAVVWVGSVVVPREAQPRLLIRHLPLHKRLGVRGGALQVVVAAVGSCFHNLYRGVNSFLWF